MSCRHDNAEYAGNVTRPENIRGRDATIPLRYELGFGDRSGDHWVGLWRLQAIAAYRRTDLLVEVIMEILNCALLERRSRKKVENEKICSYGCLW